MSRVQGEADHVRRFGEFACAAKTWSAERRVIARIKASPQGSDSRFIVTNLEGARRWLYESVYCARDQADAALTPGAACPGRACSSQPQPAPPVAPQAPPSLTSADQSPLTLMNDPG